MDKDKKELVIKTLDSFEISMDVKENKENEVLDKYKQFLEKASIFNFTFPMCTSRGILYGYDGDIQIRMSKGTAPSQ